MGNLSKFIAAIIGAIVARLVLNYTGLDLLALGIADDVNGLVYLLVEGGVSIVGALITSAFVYFFPANKPKEPEREFQGEHAP